MFKNKYQFILLNSIVRHLTIPLKKKANSNLTWKQTYFQFLNVCNRDQKSTIEYNAFETKKKSKY